MSLSPAERQAIVHSVSVLTLVLLVFLAGCGGGGGSAGAVAASHTGSAASSVRLTLQSVSPNTGPPSGNTAVTLTGTDFQAGARLTFGSVAAASVTVNSSTEIKAVTSPSSPGTVDVQLTNGNGEAAILPAAFTYTSYPGISSVAPRAGPAAGGTVIVVSGTGFQEGAAVSLGGVQATVESVTGTTKITAVTPAHAPGTADVQVKNPDETTATAVAAFAYSGASLVSVSPGVAASAGGTVVNLTGTGFAAGAKVSLGGTVATLVVVNSPTQIQVSTPPHAPGQVDVTVQNTDGSIATLPNALLYVTTPRIDQIAPNSGLSAGGTAVTLTGAGFVVPPSGAAGSTVTFGGVPAQATVVSSTQINLVTPPRLVGAVDVTVANPDGSSDTLASAFRYGTLLFSDDFELGNFSRESFVYSPSRLTINTDPAFVHRGSRSAQIAYQLCGVGSAPPPLTFAQVSGGSLPLRTYYLTYAYTTDGSRRTPASAEQVVTVAAGSLLKVNSPSPQALLPGWMLFISTASGTETSQTSGPIPVGTNFLEPVSGLVPGVTAASVPNGLCGAAHQDDNQWLEMDFPGQDHLFVRGYVYFQSPQPGGATNIARKIYYLKSPAGPWGMPDHDWGAVLTTFNMALTISTDSAVVPPTVISLPQVLNYDRWYSIEFEVQLNTPGLSDGVARLYLDGQLLYENTALNWRGDYTASITRVEIGRQADRQNYDVIYEYRYWDDLAAADAYIGP